MPKNAMPGRRLTADVTHRIQPMITVRDTDGKEWLARTLFLGLNRGAGDGWDVADVELSIAAKPTHAFYRNGKLGVDIALGQNPGLMELVERYVGVVRDDTVKAGV